LQDLWLPKSAYDANKRGGFDKGSYKKGSYSRNSDETQRPFSSNFSTNSSRLGLRTPIASRADHAARILLGDLSLLEQLSGEDHAMLADQPEPHGPLFAWIESQAQEHGPMPWGALREGLREHSAEALALKLMSGAELTAEIGQAEAARELRQVLDRMLIERLGAQMNEAIAASKADPSALQRYRALQARKLELEAQAKANSTSQ
jgi:DNA primase